jgi:hypothetical protein
MNALEPFDRPTFEDTEDELSIRLAFIYSFMTQLLPKPLVPFTHSPPM